MAPVAGFEAISDAEWQRFLDARDGSVPDASEMLREHLAWRAATLPLPAGAPALGAGLPDLLVFDGKARSGHRVAVLMAAMYDPDLADVDTYANAIAAKLDASLDRDVSERVTIIADTRGGDGWANPPATSVVPFMRAVSATLSANFPERLHCLVVMPVPWIASTLWTVVKQFLDPETARKVVLLDGAADRAAPLPDSLGEYLDQDCTRLLTEHRSRAIEASQPKAS